MPQSATRLDFFFGRFVACLERQTEVVECRSLHRVLVVTEGIAAQITSPQRVFCTSNFQDASNKCLKVSIKKGEAHRR